MCDGGDDDDDDDDHGNDGLKTTYKPPLAFLVSTCASLESRTPSSLPSSGGLCSPGLCCGGLTREMSVHLLDSRLSRTC